VAHFILASNTNTFWDFRGGRWFRSCWSWSRGRAGGTIIDGSFRASTRESRDGVGTNRSRLRTSVFNLLALVDVVAVESITTVTFVTLARVARTLVGASSGGTAVLPGETDRILGIGTLVNVGTAQAVSNEAMFANAFESSLGVVALGVG
jgi:hypothetical protein